MRRTSRAVAVVVGFLVVSGAGVAGAQEGGARRPNVLVVITDDQGHGDLGIHGNPVVKTPNLDRLARDGVRLTRFQVEPVCAPTRACLMTGRYNYRTGVTDTFLGRALMHTDELTLAEMLSAAGYRTAIFGKWHLGDNAPMRPIDQGFQEALVLKGGGIGQPSDPPGGSSYFDPLLQHNGRPERRKGYCSDVFTDAAIDFISDRSRDRPFFVYLAFNAPHAPLEVPDSDYKPYASADLSNEQFPRGGFPLPGPAPKDVTARVYGMVSNIDDNLGRLFGKLDALGLTGETLVIYLTDNGPQQVRYVSGMRGRKGTVYDGGIRVPCFVRWPGRLASGSVVDRIAAAIDITPTVLDACGVTRPAGVAFDGVSLWPLLTGRVAPSDWPDRTLFAQWHRGDVPEKCRAFAARTQQFKLVRAEGPKGGVNSPFQLFDTEADPYEQHDLASDRPEVVERLKASYAAWFDDVSKTRGYDPPPRIHLGSALENPTTLTPQDWRGPRASWEADGLGYWEVEVVRPGTFDVSLSVRPSDTQRVARLKIGDVAREAPVRPGAEAVRFEGVPLPAGPGRLEAWVEQGRQESGVRSADVQRRD
jgi:arylsulfatase A-like enzyme